MKKLIGSCVIAALSISACSLGVSTTETVQTSAPASTSTPAATSAPEKTTEPAVTLPDPREITGLSLVSSLEDPEPITSTEQQQLPATVTDYEGNAVTVTDTSRILALDLTGTIAETVIALGYGDNIVGRSISSTEDALADVPIVTQEGHSLNAEAILNLRPTVLFIDRSIGPIEVVQQIQSTGIPVVIMESNHTLDTVDEQIQSVGDALGIPETGKALAERTQEEITAAREQIAQWTPAEPLDVAFLYVRGTAGVFFILGGEQGATDLIEAVGANDVAGDAGITTTSPANAEALLSVNPEVIFTMSDGLESTEGMEGLLARPGVSTTIAGKKQRVVAIPDGLSLAFGPQTPKIMLAVAQALYGVDQ